VESVVFDVQRRRVTVGSWSERATAITPPRDVGAPWTVVLELRRHVNLRLEADNGVKRHTYVSASAADCEFSRVSIIWHVAGT
jgi:hypothetical protein